MSNDIQKKIINAIIKLEGGFVDNPKDSGGPTRYGITEAAARAYGYEGDMEKLPKSLAFDILTGRYWTTVMGTALEALSIVICEEVVDTSVNLGNSRAANFLQRSLNVFNKGGELYPDLTVDAVIGPVTLAALESYLSARDGATLAKALNCLQGAFYIELAERRQKDEEFIYGWLRNRVSI